MVSIGSRLKKLRNEKDLTQEKLGEMIGVVKSTISQYETNTSRPDYETLQKLADFFNVSVDYLLGREKPLISQNPREKTPLDDLSPEAKEKALEYIEMLKMLDQANAQKNCIDLTKKNSS